MEKLSLKSIDTANCYVAIDQFLKEEKRDFDLAWDLDDVLITLEVHKKRYVDEYNKLIDKYYDKAEEGAKERPIKKDVKFDDFVKEAEKLNERKVQIEVNQIDASKFKGIEVDDYILKTLKANGIITKGVDKKEKK